MVLIEFQLYTVIFKWTNLLKNVKNKKRGA